MKFLMGMLVAVFMVSGCTETVREALTRADTIVQRGAPYACKYSAKIYGGWVGSGRPGGSDRQVEVAYAEVYKLCLSPSTITAVQLVTVTNKTAEMIKAIGNSK